MQGQHKPVLIFAQSGRFLAQSATQAGYRVWVADCFGDQETLAVAERWQQLPSFSELSTIDCLSLLSTITQGEECLLIYGSGIELTYSMLKNLPSNIQLISNTFTTVHAIQSPQLFFKLLDQHKLKFPETKFERPEDSSNWLVKSALGMGGEHIHHLNIINTQSHHYFQRYISGTSGSALFLSNATNCQIITINKQTLSENQEMPFQLGCIENHWAISAKHKDELKLAIDMLTIDTGLIGINSLDFIISDQDELLLLEVNPRPSASADLITNKSSLFQHHINACQGVLPQPPLMQSATKMSIYTIYAPTELIIPKSMDWPQECLDIPEAASLIPKGRPICTSLVSITEEQAAIQLHSQIEINVLKQLLPTT